MTDITVTDTPHGLHLDTDGGTPVTLSPDTVAAIVQHELGKLGLYLAQDGRGIVAHERNAEGWHAVIWLDKESDGWDYDGVTGGNTAGGKVLAEYLATLPAEPELPKPGETWEIGAGADTHTAVVVEAPDGSACFVWHPHGDIAIRHVSRFEGCRRKLTDAPTTALDKVRAALAGHPHCDRHDADDPVTCGWKLAVLDVQAALDGADS